MIKYHEINVNKRNRLNNKNVEQVDFQQKSFSLKQCNVFHIYIPLQLRLLLGNLVVSKFGGYI